jgi:dCTP diphosphatase
MPDLEQLRVAIRNFRDEQDWMQFCNAKTLSCSIVIEAAELPAHFQWKNATESEATALDKRDEIAEEIADVAIYLIEFAHNLGIDLAQADQKNLVSTVQSIRRTRQKAPRKSTANSEI